MKTKTNLRGVGRPQNGLYKQGLNSPLLSKSFPYAGNYTVYGLASSDEPDTIHYVGVTGRDLNHRYNDHIAKAKHGRSRKEQWINELLNDGHQLVLITLEDGIATLEDAYERETYYIAELGKTHPLKNTSKGGKGPLGMIHSPETRRRQSAAHRGKKYRLGKKTSCRTSVVSRYFPENISDVKAALISVRHPFYCNAASTDQ